MLGAHISPLVGIHLFGVLLASSWFGEPRLLACSRARPQPLVRRAPAGTQSPVRSCRAPRARPQPLVRRAPAGAQRSARGCRAPRARPQPVFRRAPARARALRASAVLPGRVLNPVRQLLLSWLSVPTRSNAVDALVCPESSGLITSCAAYPRDPASPVSSYHPHRGAARRLSPRYLYWFPQLIYIDTLLTNNGPGNNFRL